MINNNLQPMPSYVRPNISGNVNSKVPIESTDLGLDAMVVEEPVSDISLVAKEELNSNFTIYILLFAFLFLIILLGMSIYRRQKALKQ